MRKLARTHAHTPPLSRSVLILRPDRYVSAAIVCIGFHREVALDGGDWDSTNRWGEPNALGAALAGVPQAHTKTNRQPNGLPLRLRVCLPVWVCHKPAASKRTASRRCPDMPTASGCGWLRCG
jgi:hypothetical protein